MRRRLVDAIEQQSGVRGVQQEGELAGCKTLAIRHDRSEARETDGYLNRDYGLVWGGLRLEPVRIYPIVPRSPRCGHNSCRSRCNSRTSTIGWTRARPRYVRVADLQEYARSNFLGRSSTSEPTAEPLWSRRRSRRPSRRRGLRLNRRPSLPRSPRPAERRAVGRAHFGADGGAPKEAAPTLRTRARPRDSHAQRSPPPQLGALARAARRLEDP